MTEEEKRRLMKSMPDHELRIAKTLKEPSDLLLYLNGIMRRARESAGHVHGLPNALFLVGGAAKTMKAWLVVNDPVTDEAMTGFRPMFTEMKADYDKWRARAIGAGVVITTK